MNEPKFHFRPLNEQDLPMMQEWLMRPHLQKWWRVGELNLEEVRSKYLPRVHQQQRGDARPFLAILSGRPIGFIQYYLVSQETLNWWPDEPGKGVLGIDQFIAGEADLGKGLGTAIVSQFAARLFKDPGIREIRLDPRPDNLRAIRCYEKAGFQKVCAFTNPDGPALLMVIKRPVFSKFQSGKR